MPKMIFNEITFDIPGSYKQLDSMPEDPKDSMVFHRSTPNADCFLIGYPVDYSQSLPHAKEDLIDGIRSFLGENQGIIEVEAGDDYVYSIVKAVREGGGVQYILTFQKFLPDNIINIQGVFDETGITGQRDAAIFAKCMREGLVEIGEDGNSMKGWAKDPYDESFTFGKPKNLSENQEYDSLFPDFPLSICRETLKTMLNS